MGKKYTIHELARKAAGWHATRNALRAAATVDKVTKIRATRMACMLTLLSIRIGT